MGDIEGLLRAKHTEHASSPVVGISKIVGGGYTPAGRFRVSLADGRSLFAKVGASPLTSAWIRDEARMYASLEGTERSGSEIPRFFGLVDHEDHPILLLEDLSDARWPPPWQPGDLQRLQEALARVASHRPLPIHLPRVERDAGWREVQRDPAPFLSLSLCSGAWLEAALPELLAAQESADLAGEDLLHRDLRSDNLCFRAGGASPALVDWNMAARGPAIYDVAFFAPSCRLEGGPAPEDLVPDAPAWAALVSGFFACRAGLPEIPDAPRVRAIQRRQLVIALSWAVRALSLPALDKTPARDVLVLLDTALAEGRLSEEDWYARTEETLVDAYLSQTDPRAMSGKSGDETDWRWSRELILDAVRGKRADLLDVGCAGGYLMASLARWGAERGLQIEPYGLEISERLASLARRSYPQWASRIATGNILSWQTDLRFDVVHLGLDYVPPARRSALVRRVLSDLLRPGGALVLRPERGGDPVADLAAAGLPGARLVEAVHPHTGAVRRSAICWFQPEAGAGHAPG